MKNNVTKYTFYRMLCMVGAKVWETKKEDILIRYKYKKVPNLSEFWFYFN
jgi:hypothetical protein